MDLTSYFNDLLSEIRPTSTQRKNLQDAHRRLKERLEADDQPQSKDRQRVPSGKLSPGDCHAPPGGRQAGRRHGCGDEITSRELSQP